MLGEYPTNITCPYCNKFIQTETHYKSGDKAWVYGLIIFLFGGILGCFLIPCFLKCSKDIHHFCPSCTGFIGKYQRWGGSTYPIQ